MRRFILWRTVDATGVSGVGQVAEGAEFTDGKVAMRWTVGPHRSTAIYESIQAVEAIHGHEGRTTVRWLD